MINKKEKDDISAEMLRMLSEHSSREWKRFACETISELKKVRTDFLK